MGRMMFNMINHIEPAENAHPGTEKKASVKTPLLYNRNGLDNEWYITVVICHSALRHAVSVNIDCVNQRLVLSGHPVKFRTVQRSKQ